MTPWNDPHVSARIREYCGARGGEGPTCAYLRVHRAAPGSVPDRLPPEALQAALNEGAEVERSLWDHRSLLAHLDIEHVHFDDPQAAWRDPNWSFAVQRPVVEAVEALLLDAGIAPLHLMSGRGHHFVWSMDLDSHVVGRLEALGRLRREVSPGVPEGLARAFQGLGLVMEHLGHEILRMAARATPIPIQITAVHVGPGARGREIVSVDLSEYGDPLHLRTIRVPFGPYLKRLRLAWSGAFEEDPGAAPMVAVPLHEMDEVTALLVMRDPEAAARLARQASVRIPEASGPMETLVDRYEDSALAGFHRWYYEAAPDGAQDLPWLPPCVHATLQHPNDRLLKPAGVQMVVRALMAEGWPPHHIADHIRSVYEEDHGWSAAWHFADASLRADFYTRLFSGMVITGLDDLVDFNCRSNQEKGWCPLRDCAANLLDLATSLRERREHGWPACLAGEVRP